MVAAAGNHSVVEWPANQPHVLAVGRDDGAGAAGKQLDIVAPGAHMLLPDATTFGTWSTSASGTSFASPIVAGAAARVWGQLDINDPQAVVYLLRKNATAISRTSRYGSGRVNINAAPAGRTGKGAGHPGVGAERPAVDRAAEGGVQADVQAERPRHAQRRQGRLLAPDRPEHVPEARNIQAHGVSAECLPGHGGVYIKVSGEDRGRGYTVTIPRR